MNTNPHFHHLNSDDMHRIMAGVNDTAVPLVCHEDDCFVEGSELHAQPTVTPMEPSISAEVPHVTRQTS